MNNQTDNENPLRVTLVKEKKEWYKRWWGVIIALFTLPFFIIWYAWAKSSWNKGVKIAVTVVMSLIIIGMTGDTESNNGNQVANTATNSNQQEVNNEPAPSEIQKIGTVVRDGKFEFVVSDFECGLDYIESRYGSREVPQGQYCTLALSVKNIGQSEQEFSPNAQKLLDDNGIEYSYDSGATYYKNNSDSAYKRINPGNGIETVLAFDVPKDKSPVAVELHDSVLSNGTKVSLQD
jgi:hypothetical protein